MSSSGGEGGRPTAPGTGGIGGRLGGATPGGLGGSAGSAASSPDGGGAPQATTFTLSSSSGGTKLPFTVGLVFKKSDVPSDFALDLPAAQVEVKRRWNDGSVKHAVVSGHVDLAAGQPKTVTVVAAGGAGSAKLVCTDIRTAAPQVSVTLGAFGSVDLGAQLASPTRTWLSGPEAVECHYRAKVGADPTLRVEFQVRLYRQGRVFVRVIVENGYLDVPTASKSYAPVVTIGGQAAYDTGGQPLTQDPHTRWFAEGWIGGDPRVIPKHDVTGLIASRLVPNYKQKPAAPAALEGLYRVYHPYEHGDWTPNMGETGFQNQIGLLPNWDALYVTSGADPRALASSMANAKALNSYPLVWRDSADDGVVHPAGRPTWTVEGQDAGGDTTVGAGTLVWDNAHHGSGGYLAYLVTGDYLFLETMEMQSSLAYLMISSSQGAGPARILTGQTRAMAWADRTIGQYAAVAPVDSVTDDYRALLAANAAHWRGVAATLKDHKLGVVYTYELADTAYGPGLLLRLLNLDLLVVALGLLAVDEAHAGPHERDQRLTIDPAPRCLGGSQQLEGHCQARGP